MIPYIRSAALITCASALPLLASAPTLICEWDTFDANQFDDCLALASQEKSNAEYAVGMAYLTGTGVERDPVEGENWVHRSANQAFPDAEYRMGLLKEAAFDRSEETDLESAKTWFSLAAKHLNTDAAYSLALIYLGGKGGVAKNVDEATKLLVQAAENHNNEASAYLSDLYLVGKEVAKNPAEALKWRIRSAEDGNALARTQLNMDYLYGSELTPKNLPEAIKSLTISANDDVIESQVMLAYLLSNDKDVTRNIPESIKWFSKVSDEERSEEICVVFFDPAQYLRRHSIDSKKAVDWCTKEAKKGNANAQFAMAFINKDFKDGVPNNELGKALNKKWRKPATTNKAK